MAFTPRLSAPAKNNAYYYSSNVFYKSGYGIPNCTCYAWGRFYEISGQRPRLSTSNAENWYGNTADGYKRSQTPQLGAVICWRKGKAGNGADGAGHVAIVEKIYANGDILTSNSAWKSTAFYTKTLKKSNNYSMGGSYVFQGFILNPAVTTSAPITNTAPSTSSSSIKFQCKVTSSNGLNVRSGAGTNYGKVGALGNGASCDIITISSNGAWGQLPGGGWVNLPYTTAKTTPFKAIVTANSGVNIRSGAGTNYKRTGGLTKGTICDMSETSSDGKWGKLSNGKGYVSLGYAARILVTCKVSTSSGLNIRTGPGTGYKKNGLLKNGTTCHIIAMSTDMKWGKLSDGKGWISLSYVTKA